MADEFIVVGDRNPVKQTSLPLEGLGIDIHDYVSVAYTNATTETYTFKQGGASGVTATTIVIVYTDSTKGNISTITKTPFNQY